ncbi:MAG: D-tyrosyl-tRNA(Tyr) deacylase [Deltaproteobacteria bacterium]|nr:D-tyrosyl-tRNA(Tyr) deacylase [Deltaproteobacteria bacterium]MBW2246359.1 D-tyrosyl-tRNA(Tyr) deacylase [Deltaproteobacteria bacterium]MBW2641629.1 D-tyrosyl-tRNA(Tyr) deacylase [Deltaproteobacteria bacterium]MBW2681156.1 D-tyrosyl-tRNA(Tyr) deacylase [Deltaproteobacteria bacterium]
MRAVVQRVKSSSVTVDGRVVAEIGDGLLVLLGVAKPDKSDDADYLAEKIVNLRIFEDEDGKLNRSVLSTGGQMLVVSQFTLLGNCNKGRRPSFVHAAGQDQAVKLYERFIEQVREKGVSVKTGRFRATMEVGLINDGPVTLIVESK